jgi:hypothetical protein
VPLYSLLITVIHRLRLATQPLTSALKVGPLVISKDDPQGLGVRGQGFKYSVRDAIQGDTQAILITIVSHRIDINLYRLYDHA